jgi:serine protease Do
MPTDSAPPPPETSPRGYLQAMSLVAMLSIGAAAVTAMARRNAPAQPANASDDAAVLEDAREIITKLDQAAAALSRQVLPCVVSIDTTSLRFADQVVLDGNLRPKLLNREVTSEAGIGSGVIVSAEGHIVTNYHVLRPLDLKNGADRLDVWLHDAAQPESVEVLGWSIPADVAVLKLKSGKGRTFSHLHWGNSDDVGMGHLVFAFGSPFGLAETMTVGRISNHHRKLGAGDVKSYFQTDCIINPGNSGGPLVNARGEIIGINWALYNDDEQAKGWQGIGLVLPGNFVRRVAEDIIEKKTPPPYVGLDFGEQTLGSGAQVVISTVDAAGPAAKAGLKVGDIVMKVDGAAPVNAVAAWKQVDHARKAKTVSLQVIRAPKLEEVLSLELQLD